MSLGDKKISTTQLAKLANIESRELFDLLSVRQWIKRSEAQDKRWLLTAKGEFEGGEYFKSDKYGTYIVWPKSVLDHQLLDNVQDKLLTATKIGKRHNVSARLTNHVIQECGWISKHINGWQLTAQGKALGGVEQEHSSSGALYAVWPESILSNKHLKQSLICFDADSIDVRTGDQFPTLDGRTVNSAQHAVIANWLYVSGLVYSYQRPLAGEANLQADFYLPTASIYIEYWQESSAPEYLAAKFDKIELFKQLQMPMIELTNDDVKQIDDVLAKLLLKYGVKVY